MARLVQLFLIFFVISFLTFSNSITQAQVNQRQQVRLFGKVTDSSTKEPIPFVNVYIANSFMGSATDEFGEFTILDVPLGNHNLIISHIGYAIQKQPIRLTQPGVREINFKLKPKVIQGEEVVVSAVSPKDWNKNLKTFLKEFIGSTSNADDCVLLNPEVLDFNYYEKSKVLNAEADVLLEIDNRNLGYKIKLYLEEFSLGEDVLRYAVTTFFEELTPKNEKESEKWKEKRLDVYTGSFKHFLTALDADLLEREGFIARIIPSIPGRIEPYSGERVYRDSILYDTALSFEKTISFDDYMQVVFYNRRFNERTSWIKMNYSRVTVNSYGILNNPYGVVSYGDWGAERVADLLPLEYNPLREYLLLNKALLQPVIVEELQEARIVRTLPDEITIPVRLPGSFGEIVTEDEFYAYLENVDEATFKREIEYPLLLLVSDREKDIYNRYSLLESRKDFVRVYWNRENPNPLLEENDWLSGFIERQKYVRENFAITKPPYFDDRGKYYLKYGEPDARYRDGGGPKFSKFLYSIDDLISQIPAPGMNTTYKSIYPDRNYSVYPNETWSYENITDNFVIHFVKEGSKFEEVKSLNRAFMYASMFRDKVFYWNDMMKERQGISASLDESIESIIDTEEQLRTYFNLILWDKIPPGLLVLQTKDVNPAIPEIAWQKLSVKQEYSLSVAKMDAPQAVYRTEKAIDQLNFFDDITQFREPDGSTRVEVVTLIPIENNIVESFSTGSYDSIRIEYSGMLRNLRYDPIIRVHDVMKFAERTAAAENIPNAQGNLIFIAPSINVELALQVKDLFDDRIGYSKQYLDIRDFSGEGLMVSDIQLYTSYKNANQTQVLPVIDKEGRLVVHYPYREIRKFEPPFLYYEVYNLIDGGLSGRYETEISLVWDNDREGLANKIIGFIRGNPDYSLTVSSTRTVTQNTQNELIMLDLDLLKEGPYILTITVSDPDNPQIAASVRKLITVTK